MASQGFWDPRISVCFATHYIFWWAVLETLASHPIHPPYPQSAPEVPVRMDIMVQFVVCLV